MVPNNTPFRILGIAFLGIVATTAFAQTAHVERSIAGAKPSVFSSPEATAFASGSDGSTIIVTVDGLSFIKTAVLDPALVNCMLELDPVHLTAEIIHSALALIPNPDPRGVYLAPALRLMLPDEEVILTCPRFMYQPL